MGFQFLALLQLYIDADFHSIFPALIEIKMATAVNEASTSEIPSKPARSAPTTSKMLMQALRTSSSSKGMSLQAIKKAIILEHPSVADNFSNNRLRKALTKALDSTEVVRAGKAEAVGFKGYFKLNRAVLAQQEKEKKQALKEKAKKAAEKEKTGVKKPAAKKITEAAAKSPKKTAKPPKKSSKSPTKKVAKVAPIQVAK